MLAIAFISKEFFISCISEYRYDTIYIFTDRDLNKHTLNINKAKIVRTRHFYFI